jgi:hypothetical protein
MVIVPAGVLRWRVRLRELSDLRQRKPLYALGAVPPLLDGAALLRRGCHWPAGCASRFTGCASAAG